MDYETAKTVYKQIIDTKQSAEYTELIATAVTYARTRVDYLLANAEKRRWLGSDRTAVHNVFILACNNLAQAMGEHGEDVSWRSALGQDRKVIGDFACYTALDCRVLTRMGSDLLSMYVGGTEKNIRLAFREAEAEHAILFIDEADGMFQSREFAVRSWEITQVNELLGAMENFNGVLICATNFCDNLDAATIRRFTFKLEFDYLDAAGKRLFYQRMLGNLCQVPLTVMQERRLAEIDHLTPGDFRTVRQAWYYLGNQTLSHDRLLESLEEENRAKRQRGSAGGRIGFNG